MLQKRAKLSPACQHDQLQLHDGACQDPLDRSGQVEGEVVRTAGQVKVVDCSELQDVEEAGKEGHSSADGGTDIVALLQRCFLRHGDLGVVCEDQPHGEHHKANSLHNLCLGWLVKFDHLRSLPG